MFREKKKTTHFRYFSSTPNLSDGECMLLVFCQLTKSGIAIIYGDICPVIKALRDNTGNTVTPKADRSQLPKVAVRGYSRQLASSRPSWQSWWPSQRFQLGIHFFGWWHSNSNRSHCPSWVGVEAAVEFARKMLF